MFAFSFPFENARWRKNCVAYAERNGRFCTRLMFILDWSIEISLVSLEFNLVEELFFDEFTNVKGCFPLFFQKKVTIVIYKKKCIYFERIKLNYN